MSKDQDKCEISMCRDSAVYIYYKHPVCEKHWIMHCEGKICLKEEFGIKEDL